MSAKDNNDLRNDLRELARRIREENEALHRLIQSLGSGTPSASKKINTKK